MDYSQVIASRSFPNRSSLSDPHPANDTSNLGLRVEKMEKTRDSSLSSSNVKVSSLRQRRRKRLIDRGRITAARASPPTSQQIHPQQQHSLLRTVSENKSMDHSHNRLDKDKLSISADATAETTLLSSGETPEMSPADSIRVRKVPFTPSDNGALASESAPLPQSILTMSHTQTFPPPDDEQPIPMPMRLTVTTNNSSRLKATDMLPSSHLLPRRQRQRAQPFWDGSHRQDRVRDHTPQRQRIPPAPALTPSPYAEPKRSMSPLKRFSKPKTKSFDESNKQVYRSKPKPVSSRPKPKLKRHSTAPLPTTPEPTKVVDDVLMDRAFIIRQNLMNFEMQELAAEAEKAAESGLKKFSGSTSNFGAEETPPYRPKFVDDGEFLANGSSNDGLMMTPSRRKSFVDTFTHPMDYTPSYFSRKKIPVTSLRNFSEIVPNFGDMHDNIRLHLGREGVDLATLPELHSRRSLIKNDTDDTAEKEEYGEGDAMSVAPSVAASHAESISSFSSYAVASLASLKEIIEYVNRPKSSKDNGTRTTAASTVSNGSHYNMPVPKEVEHPTPPRRHAVDFTADSKKGIHGALPHPAMHFKPAGGSFNSDSDDSSVEFYGRKSPIDLNHSATSNMSENMPMNQWKSSLAQPRSKLSSSGDRRRRRLCSSHSVSFETEKASYQALLDKMHYHASPSVSFDVDQNSCAPSLTNMDIDMLSMSPTVSTTRSTPMANFLSKIGFSRSVSTDGNQRSMFMDEENDHFVSNFFYTSETSNNLVVPPNVGVPTLKLDINPERDRDPYCLSGCGPNNVLSACESATKYADILFDWFNVGSNNQPRKHSAIIDPKAPQQVLHPKWMQTWQTNESQDYDGRRLFTPPKLSVNHHTLPREDDIFCSPDSAKLGGDCDSTMTCLVARESGACSEFQNKMGCSPE
eukprot:CAMPEP_0201671050 /NCGR_PEP_ID=MMETSP0494-20130426/28465_1 /ASSEMBLY_ACC=CAM_ASM_000839 /TAXON_ID=420259 /ORGANISM="Thalassiosira gravida, Strain GMp14c1" /LENGTH=915 /DNA_ID=CAMNT_0048152283 /DNA_START=376 /DNA_END=3123 /DNA_ORIENTATION=+